MPPSPVSPLLSHELHDVKASQEIESRSLASGTPHDLMDRAGTHLAALAMALAPHARMFWVACGPGNNGGDGLIAALRLHQAGHRVWISRSASSGHMKNDAAWALSLCDQAGLVTHDSAPQEPWGLAIDALFGLGARPGMGAPYDDWLRQMRISPALLLCADVPSGLDAGSGTWSAHPDWLHRPPNRTHTLSLLTLKTGLYTGAGRDAAGQIWFDDLQRSTQGMPVTATLLGKPIHASLAHDTHKGNMGHVWVVGGDRGMAGAAWLAGQSALRRGAGRVHVQLLHPETTPSFRPLSLMTAEAFPEWADELTVVAGCGGGRAIRTALPRILSVSRRLVLDADALNALAMDPNLQGQLRARAHRGWQTVLTPHPLEAARMLNSDTTTIQADRLEAARQLARWSQSVVVLKGSGSIVAHPDGHLGINPTGNHRLSTAGSGDVLAGWIGARLAQGEDAWKAATHAVYEHGLQAETGPQDQPLIADDQ